jgi:hypothetical protein
MSRPAPKHSKKHKLSDSEESESEETEELASARSVPLSGLAHKKPRKSELDKLSEGSGLDFDPGIGGFSVGSGGRSAKQQSGFATRDRRTERQRGGPKPVAIRPHYEPLHDKHGRKLWKGSRAGLGWFDNVKTAMISVDDGSCQIKGDGCTGGSDAIDHVKDFATEQTGLETSLICDGKHHWKAILLSDAQQLYNGGFDDDDDFENDDGALARLQKAFVWSCTHCNSSKSGKKGLDGGAAIWQKACPGEEDCDL